MKLLTEEPKVHSFTKKRKQAGEPETVALLDKFYRLQFGTMLRQIERINYQSDHVNAEKQKSGIDVILHFGWEVAGRAYEKQVTVDEKIRYKVWPDILLEIWSDTEAKAPGWIFKPGTDFINYVFLPDRRFYFIPSILLLKWVFSNWDYILRCPRIPVDNEENGRCWITTNHAVPIEVLLNGITEIMCAYF